MVWNGDYERHAMARMGIKTGRKQRQSFGSKINLAVNKLEMEKEVPYLGKYPKRLETVKMGKKTYFVDSRLNELRNVKNPSDVKPLDKDTGDAIAFASIWNKYNPSKVSKEAVERNLRKKDFDEINQLKLAHENDNKEYQHKLLERLEDKYHVDLTHFYGEDYSDKKNIQRLKRKLKM